MMALSIGQGVMRRRQKTADRQWGSSVAALRLPGQTLEAWDTLIKPPFEPGSAPPLGQKENAEANLAEENGIDGDFPLVPAEPLDDASVRGDCIRNALDARLRG